MICFSSYHHPCPYSNPLPQSLRSHEKRSDHHDNSSGLDQEWRHENVRKEDTEDVWQMLHPGVERRAHQRSEYCKDNRVPKCLHRNFWKDYNSLRNPILPTTYSLFVESCIKDHTVIIYNLFLVMMS